RCTGGGAHQAYGRALHEASSGTESPAPAASRSAKAGGVDAVDWIRLYIHIEIALLSLPPNRVLRRPSPHHRVIIPRTKPHEPCLGIKQPSGKPERRRLHVALQHRHLAKRSVLRSEEHVRDVAGVHHE